MVKQRATYGTLGQSPLNLCVLGLVNKLLNIWAHGCFRDAYGLKPYMHTVAKVVCLFAEQNNIGLRFTVT